MCSLVPSTGPVLCRDEMEEWSASEANLFEEALDKYGKDFTDIRHDFVSTYRIGRRQFDLSFRLHWFLATFQIEFEFDNFELNTKSLLVWIRSCPGRHWKTSLNIITCGRQLIVMCSKSDWKQSMPNQNWNKFTFRTTTSRIQRWSTTHRLRQQLKAASAS